MHTPGNAELIRSAQKDDEFLERLRSQLKSLAQLLRGDAWWLRWHRHLDGAVTYLYYVLTTLDGSQTLGEEFAGLVQYCGQYRLPTFPRKLLMITWHVLAPLGLSQLMSRLRAFDCAPSFPLAAPLYNRLLDVLPALLHHCHQTVFYLTGEFYHWSKRVAGVRYLSIHARSDALSARSFALLGLISLLCLLAKSAVQLHGIAAAPGARDTDSLQTRLCQPPAAVAAPPPPAAAAKAAPAVAAPPPPPAAAAPAAAPAAAAAAGQQQLQFHCVLCVDVASVASALPCGHVMCWQCGTRWLHMHAQCPVCRAHVQPSRLVPLVL